MHEVTITTYGAIDGKATCPCGWKAYKAYPGRGWGRKSIGIKRTPNTTKPQWIQAQLLNAYVKHEVRVTA